MRRMSMPYLPTRKRLDAYLDELYKTRNLTNKGPLVQQLTSRLAEYWGLDARRLVLVSSGTMALQVAYRALKLTGSVITTPFTFIATSSTLSWEGLEPLYCDIDPLTWNLDPDRIEGQVRASTSAIVPVHVFGIPAAAEQIESVAQRFALKTVYDASHAFDVRLNSRSILDLGDASTISFHATKLFHSCEGGAIYFKHLEDAQSADRLINFGIDQHREIHELGINGKMSEMHAAMGLAVLDEIEGLIESRRRVQALYIDMIGNALEMPHSYHHVSRSVSYFPVLFSCEEKVISALDLLKERGIEARRYFYPSLDTLAFLPSETVPISQDISRRILCLPCYGELQAEDVREITNVIVSV